MTEREERPEPVVVSGKSVGTAAALGVVIPGGGEFYAGNTGKGLAVLGGSAAALAAGYLITSEEVVGVSYTANGTPQCDATGTSCTYPVTKVEEVEETRQIVYGAAAAGALWLYGLIDGVRTAKRSQAGSAEDQVSEDRGVSLEVAPADGVRYTAFGEVELTFIRIRS